MSDPKFKLGEHVYWIYSGHHMSKEIKCPMCFGTRMVKLILGDGSEQNSECGYCDRGMEHSTGVVTTREPQAIVRSGEIEGVFKETGGWRYKCRWETLDEIELFHTEEGAEPVRALRQKEEEDREALWFRENFKTGLKKQIWNTGYHKRCIQSDERSIRWHQMRLAMIEERKATR